MAAKKYKTLEELEEKYIGEKGTPDRDEYEFELTMEMLGEKIKEIRKRRNLSQEELGKLIGVQKAQVSKLENGKSSATLATINKIFRAMRAKAKLHIEFEDESGLVV